MTVSGKVVDGLLIMRKIEVKINCNINLYCFQWLELFPVYSFWKD